MNPNISLGRIVLYKLTKEDAEAINRRRTHPTLIQSMASEGKWPAGAQAHIGNSHQEGELVPAVVVRVWSGTCVNLKVMLDGNDDLWKTSISEEKDSAYPTGFWMWPPRV